MDNGDNMVSQGETYAGMGREMRAMTVGKSDERPKGDRMFSLAERAAKAFGGNRRTGSVWIRSDHRLLGDGHRALSRRRQKKALQRHCKRWKQTNVFGNLGDTIDPAGAPTGAASD